MPVDIYAALGVKRRINAAGTLTRLGGALMDEEVGAAMAAAARASVDIGELQSAASRGTSKITGAEAAIVTTGAAAALTLAAAAAMTRWDVARMAALPHADAFSNEIVLPRTVRVAPPAFRIPAPSSGWEPTGSRASPDQRDAPSSQRIGWRGAPGSSRSSMRKYPPCSSSFSAPTERRSTR
jgi:hypothetical protein